MLEMRTEKSLREKLHILADAAKYDVACTSSGVDRKGEKGALGNSCASGICHSFAADGRCISLLKILMTNHCAFDCKYCINRRSNDVERTTFSPREICELTIGFYKRNYIEGLFLSSGVLHTPEYTMERICETLRLLREEYRFRGYIHVKMIPGAPEALLSEAALLADRVSINLELPTADSLHTLAPHKSFHTILTPMEKTAASIARNRIASGKSAYMERSSLNNYLSGSIFSEREAIEEKQGLVEAEKMHQVQRTSSLQTFAPAGMSTQMIVGATGESDYQYLLATEYMYRKYDLKRVFFSAYVPLIEDTVLPELDTPVPLLREHRLYQADWLLRFYGFQAKELLSEQHPNFNEQIDPKCNWAVHHLALFPIEVQTASMEMLLRVPGIGPKSVRRIVKARKYANLSFEDLKKMGVVLKRAHYFLTCNGRMLYRIPVDEAFITRQLITLQAKENWQIVEQSTSRQMSLFDDFGLH